MSRQYLIPVKDTDDAKKALTRLPEVMERDDEVVVLIVSDIPEGEMTGSAPPPTVLDPLATTGGTAAAGRAASDQPVFLGREEMMEIRGREMQEAMQPYISSLHDRGYRARAEAVFTDDAGATIRDVASDLAVTDVYITEDFRSDLDSETQERVKAL